MCHDAIFVFASNELLVDFGRLKPGKDTGEVKTAKDDGRLPMEDHNTCVVVFWN
jgi:hypothetical protein